MRAAGLALLAALLVPSLAFAQEETAAPRRDPAIEALVVDARGVLPEFSADVLLQLAGSPRVSDQAWRRDLIEEAYVRAYSAPDSYRVTATAGATPNNRQGAQVIASDTTLTRVSLQTRAVQLMATVDPRRAREMFDWIDLDLSSGRCDSPLVPSVDEYYTTLAVLARQAFGTDSDSRGDALRFMTLYLFHAHLPTEMPAVAKALRTFRPTAEETQFLEGHAPLDPRRQSPRPARLLLWFAFAKRLIELTRAADRSVVLDLLEHSGHPVLALYGHVAAALAPPRSRSNF